MKHYPIIFQAFFLDFTYNNNFNIENRLFINIPCFNDGINDESHPSHQLLCLTFEMRSSFQPTSGALNEIIRINRYPDMNYIEILDILKQEQSQFEVVIDFDNEEDIYIHLEAELKKIIPQYINNYLSYFETKVNNHYLIDNEIEKNRNQEILNNEKMKIERFFKEVLSSLHDMKTKNFFNKRKGNFSADSFEEFEKIICMWASVDLKQKLLNHNDIKIPKKKI